MAVSVYPAEIQARESDFAVGTSIPPATPHAVSVSLPKWQDNVDYEEGRLGEVMQTGYPRFFIHKSIQKLAHVLLTKFGQPATTEAEAEACLLVPSKKVADCCREFIQAQSVIEGKGRIAVREIQFCLVIPRANGIHSDGPTSTKLASPNQETSKLESSGLTSQISIHVVLFPKSAFPIAKTFWQHTGDGISSRAAEAALDILDRNDNETIKTKALNRSQENNSMSPSEKEVKVAASPSIRSYSRNKYYARTSSTNAQIPSSSISTMTSALDSNVTIPSNTSGKSEEVDKTCSDHTTYVEERFGRNMALFEAPRAKRILRKRVAGVVSTEFSEDADVVDRIDEPIKEEDVYLYPTGMSAIFHAHQLAMKFRNAKSVCFGFPYLDTLKILEKWGPGCYFLGQGDQDDLQQLEKLLKTEKITSLFCEFPSNPLLRSPDLVKLRQLADQHDFLIVIDETIGNFVNVCVLPYADIAVSSLTKIFTGEANGMGGSLVLNSKGKHYHHLKKLQEVEYEDNFFDQNAIFLERNSRDFVQRVRRIDKNALLVVDMLCKAKEGQFNKVIKNIYYPTLITSENYNKCRRPNAGYGELLSITFHSLRASAAFFDALKCAKGPSLGTNFTLASPFVILAHYNELDWAASFGVEANLVRISVGMEDGNYLMEMLTNALLCAQKEIKNIHHQ